MRRRAIRHEGEENQANRFAWWASFLITLVVVGLLSIAHSARAAGPPAAPGATFLAGLGDLGFGADAEAEEELDWEEEDECAWDEEEEEFWCADEAEEAAEEAEAEEAAARCIVSSASARVAARPARHRLDLTIRYRGERRAAVAVSWRLRGAKGKLALGTERASFARAGTFRHRETRLSEKQMSKALAARAFTVEVRALNTPASCKRELTSRLDGRRGATWFERAGKRR